jgi:hypothetical protein
LHFSKLHEIFSLIIPVHYLKPLNLKEKTKKMQFCYSVQQKISIKNTCFNAKRMPLLFWLLLFSGLVCSSCKNYSFNTEIRQLDTLFAWVESAERTLIIDPDIIRERQDSMKIILDVLLKDTLHYNDALNNAILNYRGIFSNYERFLLDYEALEYDNLRYKTLLTETKEKLIHKEFTRSNFDSFYQKIRTEIQEHLKKCRQSVKLIYSVEKMYERSAEPVNKAYEIMKET